MGERKDLRPRSSRFSCSTWSAGSRPKRPRRPFPSPPAAGRQTPSRVFLEAPGLDLARLAKDLGFVTLVSSLDAAQVQVTVERRQEAGGEMYVLKFTGRGVFLGTITS